MTDRGSFLSYRRTIARQGGAVQDPLIGSTVPRPAAVEAGTIVINDQVINLPHVSIHELSLRRPFQEFLQQSSAFFERPSDNEPVIAFSAHCGPITLMLPYPFDS